MLKECRVLVKIKRPGPGEGEPRAHLRITARTNNLTKAASGIDRVTAS